jgi:outer membrane protein OmpA-like peptidoglycan-associated protein
MGVENAKNMSDFGDSDLSESFQNSSQATKGAILGGAAGAIGGALVSGVGVLPGTAGGVILGASYGSYIDSQTTLQDQLDNRGVNVIVLGDQILIVISSSRIFNDSSPKMKAQGYSTMHLVARFINQYTKMLVKVSVYTSYSGSKRLDLALSEQQAEQVARALESSGVDARVLYAAGYGGTHFVARNTSDWRSENYRIEITLEKLTA